MCWFYYKIRSMTLTSLGKWTCQTSENLLLWNGFFYSNYIFYLSRLFNKSIRVNFTQTYFTDTVDRRDILNRHFNSDAFHPYIVCFVCNERHDLFFLLFSPITVIYILYILRLGYLKGRRVCSQLVAIDPIIFLEIWFYQNS